MKVIDLTPEHNNNYFNCLSEWSDEMQEAGDHKACWYNKYKEKGLRVKLALDEKGTVGGMIQYLPIEESFVEGKDLYFILCIWVHGYKEGRGDFQGIGMGEALLGAAESDAKEKGAKGMAVWGVWLPFWMKASWFKKHGYKKADRDSMSLLVWKPFTEDVNQPHWIYQKKPVPSTPGKVTVTAFINGWCPAQNMVYERAKRASAECGEKVIFQGIDTSDRDVFLEWGISDAIFVNGKQVAFGPPLSYEKLMKIIFKQVKKLST
jgi:N-acetylglutamate synthase-like GNAT family acetyltransferase